MRGLLQDNQEMATKIPHVAAGNEGTSYANNSSYQLLAFVARVVQSIRKKSIILKTRSILEDALKKLQSRFPNLECLKIADLGCGPGPNIFVVISEVIETIAAFSQQNNTKAPELQIFVNDLPENDFNFIFKSIPAFQKGYLEKGKGQEFGKFFIVGVPGSFYGRIFPRKSLHFVHSSYSLHWLSQVPPKLENKGNIYIARNSRPEVFEAYSKQFREDFETFLRLRSEEMVSGGQMVVTIAGRSDADPASKDCCAFWELLTKSLFDLVLKGLVQEIDIDTFDIPHYTPYKDEVKAIITEESSFNLEGLETSEGGWYGEDDDENTYSEFNVHEFGQNIAILVRAITEPMLASHFGMFILDDLFRIFAEHVAEYLLVENPKKADITISLSRK